MPYRALLLTDKIPGVGPVFSLFQYVYNNQESFSFSGQRKPTMFFARGCKHGECEDLHCLFGLLLVHTCTTGVSDEK